ncbi:gtpase-activating gyp3 [Trichoderma arundinaceum]|uniref:Gtpase-activating gyp3 n=1 Tax=Trichoderma arundinaceum TaxID=490622 RepID=A0A395N782_TRIAR|nr:gtpase-activating gyp3 [Trichoderma arundinaceum]
MTVSQTGGGHGRQQSITGQPQPQPSLYASRMKQPPPPLSSHPPSGSIDGRHRPPQLSPMPLSPRWDSVSNGSNMMLHSPMSPIPPRTPSQNSWYERYGQFDQAPSPQLQPQQQYYPQPAFQQQQQQQQQQQHQQHAATATFPARDMATGRRRPPEPLQLDSTSALITKSMRTEIRTPETPAVENFSRPRKQSTSIRSPPVGPGSLRLAYLPPSDLMPEMTSVSPSTPSWQRPRRPSASSKSSVSYVVSPSFPPTAEYLESRASRSSRNATSQPPIAGHRPQLGYQNRIDSPATVPTPSGPAPWMSDDELRSSFRSQLTSSSAPGTALTERSSVLTKDSSVLSLYGPTADADEPSLEDVMGMYERGFCDDDDDDNDHGFENEYTDPNNNHHHHPYDDQYNVGYSAPYDSYPHEPELELEPEQQYDREYDREYNRELEHEHEHGHGHGHGLEHGYAPLHTHEEEVILEEEEEEEEARRRAEEESAEAADSVPDNMISVMHRPVTARSEPVPERIHSDEFEADPVPPVPATHSALDMEIRQSKMLFSSAAFTSTVPALTHDHDLDHDPEHDLEFPEKRDSSRTMESASVDSDGIRTRGATPSPSPSRISPPSMPESRSVSPSSARLPVPQPEKPGARDRYGFKKENQFITIQQYDAWDKGYSQYLARRRKKWTSYLKDSALMTDRPQRFPAPNAKTKRFVRKGIPPDWRGAAWFYYAGGPAILAKHGGLYDKLLLRRAKHVDIEAIERDLHRTFPDNIQFKPSQATADMLDTTTSSERASQSTVRGAALDGSGPGPVGLEGEPPLIASLRRVLLAFAVYNPRIGYCQSLNFIAGLLLLFVDTEEQAFWLLNVITHIYLPGTHEMSLEGSKVDLGVLMTELRDTMPAVWDKIGGELDGGEPLTRPMTSKSMRKSPLTPRLKRKETHQALSSERLPPITLCMTAWFMSCYIGTLPIETTLRVWDVFFYEGSKTLFRVALAIFKIGEAEIKAIADPMEMFGVVQSMPRKMLDANKVLETCFKRRNGFNHLSQEVIEERRQERRDKAQQDLLLRSRSKAATTGATGREADGERKGGSLFSLKK